MRFNPPPNWPAPPGPDWQPPSGWRPDPKWGPAPAGWNLWIDDTPSDPPRPFGIVKKVATHNVWITVATLVTAAGLVAGLISWRLAGSESGARVQLAAVTLGHVVELSGEWGGPGAGGWPGQAQEVGTVPIDATLKNNGGKALRVTSIDVDVIQGTMIRQCHAGGAGPGQIRAAYSVKLPVDTTRALGEEGVKLGTVSAPADFTVAPKSTDRMVITVGPESQSHLLVELIAFTISLRLDDGSRISLPSVAAATATETVNSYVRGAQHASEGIRKSPCFAEMGKVFDDAFAKTDLQTEPLKELRSTYASVTARS